MRFDSEQRKAEYAKEAAGRIKAALEKADNVRLIHDILCLTCFEDLRIIRSISPDKAFPFLVDLAGQRLIEVFTQQVDANG